jgi:hypothetical protein
MKLKLGIFAALLVCIAACSQAPTPTPAPTPTATPTPKYPMLEDFEAIGLVREYLAEKSYDFETSSSVPFNRKYHRGSCSHLPGPLEASYSLNDFRWTVSHTFTENELQFGLAMELAHAKSRPVSPGDIYYWHVYERTEVIVRGPDQKC